MERIFGQVNHLNEEQNEWGMSKNTYRIPFPELQDFYPLLKDVERGRFVDKFNRMLKHTDDYFCEFETEGMVAGNCIYLTFEGEYGLYTPILKAIVAIRKEVRELIRARREQIVNGLRIIVLAKMVYEHLGLMVNVSLEDQVNVVFSRIMEQCGGLNLSLGAEDTLSFETMRMMLKNVLDQATINTNGKEVAA